MGVGVTRLRYSPLGVGVPTGNGDSVGFVALKQGDQIVTNHGPTKGNRYWDTTPEVPVKLISATPTTLTSADFGKVIVFDSATPMVVNLPKASESKGAILHVMQKTLTGGAAHRLTPFAGDYIGAGITALTTTASQSLLSDAAADAVGDRYSIQSNGVNGWVIIAQRTAGTLSKA